ncbi:M1-specific T cell receptor beta chain-like [Chaetodon auriga]|uniref:M1-specific T cell receptor beta chain-like n=1 Tax=Chaetodon auriga TaxID=39042 RepID=UPI004032B55B
MTPGITTITFFLLLAADVSQSVLITQWPHYISSLPSGLAEMHCYQNNTDYQYTYWYRQQRGKGFQLIVYIVAGTENFEEEFKSGFQVKSTGKQWSLTIASVQEKDEAVYLCAASLHTSTLCQYEAHFGQGTKLTVLEQGRTAVKPKVKVFKPSPKECRNQKDKAKKKTLVCVASEFYPDHVSISWQINGGNETDGVATDSAAVRDGSDYTITSRLQVPAETWFTPSSEFQCTVTFFNGTHYEYVSDSINGDEDVMTREKYLRITQTAKLSYVVLIVKSSIYGAFVAFLVWKLQSSTGKQN